MVAVHTNAFVHFASDGSLLRAQGSETDVDVLQSLFRALHALSARSLAELGAGHLRRLILDGEQGRVVLANVDGGTLVALVGPDEPLGAALAQLRAKVS